LESFSEFQKISKSLEDYFVFKVADNMENLESVKKLKKDIIFLKLQSA
jgi:hypothetical protein